jgi:hypothetical protein
MLSAAQATAPAQTPQSSTGAHLSCRLALPLQILVALALRSQHGHCLIHLHMRLLQLGGKLGVVARKLLLLQLRSLQLHRRRQTRNT